MRIILSALFFCFSVSMVFSQKSEGPKITFENSHINLGKVKRGDKKTFQFKFTNTGKEDLVFEIVSGCDCTTLDWPRKPVKPGQKGVIDVIFDSTEKEESGVVDVDVYLKNIDPKTGKPFFVFVDYSFELVQ